MGCTRTVEGDGQPNAEALAAVHDEKQINDLVQQQNTYAGNFDFAKLAETKCAKYRDATAQGGPPIPAMNEIVPPEIATTPGAGDALRGLLAQKFPTVPPDVISAVVDSLVNQDEPAYQAAMRNLLKSLIVVKAEVQDIEIKGDQATAELTVTTTTGDKPPKREQQTVKFVKENGKWLDCNPPGAGS
ncbi:lumazine-binding domain protein [Mycobacteroides abscessus subsp. bolletii 103]|nr:lumazine-binding domain protein [Mycobacteroides abscessus subsp. bolletii 103]